MTTGSVADPIVHRHKRKEAGIVAVQVLAADVAQARTQLKNQVKVPITKNKFQSVFN